MSDIAIRCEGLGKRYRIGERERYTALRDVIMDGVTSPFRKLRSTFSRNGHSNGNGNGPPDSQCEIRNPQSDLFWALKDVSFEVKRGEVVGIIGRNGAGKSTLLKILSRITAPTEGQVEVKGRVGSLLEVGTGFHPELTGRENIYLNGAILGMKRTEINRKFDEIVAFAEIEKFIDTPVKRYSSGMYVRLAFAVAAHLEPEILLVDEVLAVGDAQFQKKCLGKMDDVAKEGRTVLFVSHNMVAVQNLCSKGLLLVEGSVAQLGSADEAVRDYLRESGEVNDRSIERRKDRKGSGALRFIGITLRNCLGEATNVVCSGSEAILELHINAIRERLRAVCISVGIDNEFGYRVVNLATNLSGKDFEELPMAVQGFQLRIPRLGLTPARYSLTLFASANGEVCDWLVNAGSFDVAGGDYYGTGNLPTGPGQGLFLMDHSFELFKRLSAD
jgi:lipopolysaccharide transport system ATP-binding protein